MAELGAWRIGKDICSGELMEKEKLKKRAPRRYVKPVIIRQTKMTFPMDIIAKFNGGRFCVQCSGCHGCR